MTARPINLQRLPLRALKLGNKGQSPLGPTEVLLRTKLRTTAQGAEIKPGAWEGLEYMPRAVTGFTEQHLELPEVLTHIQEHPVAAFYTLVNSAKSPARFAKISDRLESSFLSDGELVVAYMAWIKEGIVPGLDPFKFRAHLLTHPIHGIRWAKLVGDNEFGADMLKWAHDNAQIHASAAWAIVCAYQENPESWRTLLQLDPLYMVASAATFGMKFSLAEAVSPLDGRWLYLLLLNDGCEDPEDVENHLFEQDPFWATEWILHREFTVRREIATKVFDGMKSWLARGHPLVQALAHSWTTIHEQIMAKNQPAQSTNSDPEKPDSDIFEANIDDDESDDERTARD